MIFEISVETLPARRFLFAHENLSHLAMNEVAPRDSVLGNTGCQPVDLGSLPRSSVRCSGADPSHVAGNCRLSACAPQSQLERQRQPIRRDPGFAGSARADNAARIMR